MVRERQDDDWIVDDGKFLESYFDYSVITRLGFIMFMI